MWGQCGRGGGTKSLYQGKFTGSTCCLTNLGLYNWNRLGWEIVTAFSKHFGVVLGFFCCFVVCSFFKLLLFNALIVSFRFWYQVEKKLGLLQKNWDSKYNAFQHKIRGWRNKEEKNTRFLVAFRGNLPYFQSEWTKRISFFL